MNQSAVRVLVVVLIGAVIGGGIWFAPTYLNKKKEEPSLPTLEVGGSSVTSFIVDKWKLAYRKAKGTDIHYDSSGSAAGVKKMIDKEYLIGFSATPMTEDQKKAAKAKGGEVVQIPVVLVGVVPAYRLKELADKSPLNFTAEVLANIFLGKITKWNDPAIKKANESASLPDTAIAVVYREDPSATTFTFTDYLAGASETWLKEMGPASSDVKWKTGEGKKRNTGVANYIYQTEGSIGYVELLNAINNKLQFGALQNKEGAFVLCSPEVVTESVKGVKAADLEDVNFKLTNRPGKATYPICAVDWAVVYQSQPAAKQKMVVDFLQWATHDGQQYSPDYSYGPLPPEFVHDAEEKLKTIKAGG
jgi:phosphate transport system substrate-binding protein